VRPLRGVDERVIEARGLVEVSLGDFVLSGGEPAAMALLDAVVRLLPGVMGKEASGADESFEHGLLEHPHYTRPRDFEGREIPEILLSGDHAAIARWRRMSRRKSSPGPAARTSLLETSGAPRRVGQAEGCNPPSPHSGAIRWRYCALRLSMTAGANGDMAIAMYQPAHFREDRIEVQHALIRRHPLGLLVTAGPGGLMANRSRS
jgi:hypothetical protein